MAKTELELAQERIKQLEEAYKLRSWALPPEPDPSLEEDEWWAIFGDFQNLLSGSLSKVPWQGGSNMTSTFVVQRKGLTKKQKEVLKKELVSFYYDAILGDNDANIPNLDKRIQRIVDSLYILNKDLK